MSGSAAAIWSALPHHQPNDRQLHMDHRSPAPYVSNPFDFSDLLNNRSDKRNSLSYSPSNNQQAQMHTQQHSAHPPFAPVSDFDRALAVSGAHSAHPFDHTDNMDISSEHASNYDYFPPSNGVPPFARYNRTNASSSSSLGQPYPPSLSSDSLYPHPQAPFGDSLSSFSSGNSGSFDLVNGLSSSYSSGKVSPLTPNDSVIGLQSTSGFPGLSNGVGKDGFPSSYNDLIGDRRTSNVSTGSFQSDYHDEFGTNGALGLGFSSSLPPFQERISHYPGASGLHRPPIDMMRGVNPHATHGSLSGFEDFNSIAPGTDLALRMPGQNIGVDETLSRMKLQPHVSMNATDLQSFIRYAAHYIPH